VIERLRELTGSRVPVSCADWRPGDQKVYVSDTAKAERVLGWKPETRWEDGLGKLVDWLHEADLTTPVLPMIETAAAGEPVLAQATR
jgi:CDP-paratose 2-epimerase